MRRWTMRQICGLLIVTTCMGLASGVQANKLDLALARFVDCEVVNNNRVCEANNVGYERFMAEYAFGLAPKILAPAETLGYSGFYMGLEGTLTPVPGDTQKTLWKDGTAPALAYPDVMFMPAVHIRKGLPWSFEIGSTVNYLAQSELVGLGGEIKWSVFEGYQTGFRGFLPNIAARGSVMRVLGEADVDLTIIGVDGSISYPFGIGGMIALTPYGGFQYLWTVVRIEPLVEEDPDDGLFEDQYESMIGLSSPNLTRGKLFAGFRFQYELLSMSFELGWGLKNEWKTDLGGDSTKVLHQIQISAGAGVDF